MRLVMGPMWLVTHMWGLWLVDAVVGLVAWCSVWHVHQHFQSRHLVDVSCVDDALFFQLSVIAASKAGSGRIVCIVDTIVGQECDRLSYVVRSRKHWEQSFGPWQYKMKHHQRNRKHCHWDCKGLLQFFHAASCWAVFGGGNGASWGWMFANRQECLH